MLTTFLGRSAVLIPKKVVQAQLLRSRTVHFSFRMVMKPSKATKQADISNFFSTKPRETSQKVSRLVSEGIQALAGVSLPLQWHRSKVHAVQAPLTPPKASKIASSANDTQLRGPASSASPSNRSNLGSPNPQPAKLKRLRKATEVWAVLQSCRAFVSALHQASSL